MSANTLEPNSTEYPTRYKAEHGEYPVNLQWNLRYDQVLLKRYRDQLVKYENSLFEDPGLMKVPTRDISPGGEVSKRNIVSEEVLETWLDAPRSLEQERELHGGALLPKGSNCRFISLVTPSLGWPLELTKKALLQILSYHQVMPSFLDLLFAYGTTSTKREVRSSGFRVESILSDIERTHVYGTDGLGRSDQRFQICYSLKSLSRYAVAQNWEENIRQIAVYHQFDATTGKQLWIFGDPHADLKKAIGARFHERRRHPIFNGFHPSFNASLLIHALILNTALREWRMGFQVFDAKVDDLMMQSNSTPTLEMVGSVQGRILTLDEAIAALESNNTIMTSLESFYSDVSRDLKHQQNGSTDAGVDKAVKSFTYDLHNHIREARLQEQHLMVLQKMLTERKGMLLDQLEALASKAQIDLSQKQIELSEKQERLSEVQEELSRSMWQYARTSAQETVAMRIIAVVTLIYLPPTFVSTLFSTDIVKYQSGETYSSLALERWWQVTGPLMGVTLSIAGVWFFFHVNREKREMDNLRRRNPGVYSWTVDKRPRRG